MQAFNLEINDFAKRLFGFLCLFIIYGFQPLADRLIRLVQLLIQFFRLT